MADEPAKNTDGQRDIVVEAVASQESIQRALAELDQALVKLQNRRFDGGKGGRDVGGDAVSPHRPGDVVDGRRIGRGAMSEIVDSAIGRARNIGLQHRSGLRQERVLDSDTGVGGNTIRPTDLASWIRNPTGKLASRLNKVLPAVAVAAAASHTIGSIAGDLERGGSAFEAGRNVLVKGLRGATETFALPELVGAIGSLLGVGSVEGARKGFDAWFRDMMKTDAQVRAEVAAIAKAKADAIAQAQTDTDAALARATAQILGGIDLSDEDRWELQRYIRLRTSGRREFDVAQAGRDAAEAAAKAAAQEP